MLAGHVPGHVLDALFEVAVSGFGVVARRVEAEEFR